MSGRPTLAQVDAAALRANLHAVRARVAPETEILAVVKADGYGHGAGLVATVFAGAGAAAFGVVTVDEAIEVRRAGLAHPILLLAGADRVEIDAVLEHDLSIALLDLAMLRRLRPALRGRRVRVHLKIDTGMGRLGVTPEELPALLAALSDAPEFVVAGVFSHFANADGGNEDMAARQIELFRDSFAITEAAGFAPPHRHLANSAAALARPAAHFTLVRPGIALYGIAPMADCPVTLRPAMRLVTRIVQLRTVPAEHPIGYDQTFVTRRPSRIAVLPIGYADGYDRRLSNRGTVLVRGQRAPLVGRVCMDLTLADVTDVPGVDVNDEVVLWGQQEKQLLAVSEVAACQESIAYEVLTRVGKRIPRVLVNA